MSFSKFRDWVVSNNFFLYFEEGNKDGLYSKLTMFSESVGSVLSSMHHVCPHCQPALD